MLKPRHELESWLAKSFANMEDKDKKQEIYNKALFEYDLPIDITSDILTMRRDLSEYNDFVLYIITSIVAESKIKQYYTTKEIKMYSNSKYKVDKIKKDLHLPMFEVTNDQWIGANSAKFLMQLRDAQRIIYNADTQRALQVVVRGGKEIYKPSVNYKSVQEIADAYSKGEFIPNTISLNIDLDDEDMELIYDDETKTLTIKNFTHFDIFDGYHRYLAMGINYDTNHKFDYPIELRITNFSISKAKRFIYQEDHKTKMQRIAAATYNTSDYGNLVIDKLNNGDSSFNFYHSVNLKDGLINSGYLLQIVNALYFSGNKKVERKDIIRIAKELKDKINTFSEECDEYLGRKWKKYETHVIIYGLYNDFDTQTIVKAVSNLAPETKKRTAEVEKITPTYVKMLKEVYDNG